MTIRPHSTLAAAGLAAALTLAGCGGGGDGKADTADKAGSPTSSSPSTPPSTPPSSPTDAADAATGAPTPGDPGGRGLSEVLARTVNTGKSAHVVLDIAGQGSGQGDIRLGGASPAMELRMKIAGQSTEVRMVDRVVYVAVPGQGGKFMKMDTGQSGAALGSLDPSQALEQLEKSGAEAKDLGGGHWQVTKSGTTTDLYTGDSGYLERVETNAAAGHVTMTFSDWGKKVDVQAPPASRVVTAPGA